VVAKGPQGYKTIHLRFRGMGGPDGSLLLPQVNNLVLGTPQRYSIMRLTRLLEDLDDKDEFDCRYCRAFIYGARMDVENQEAFHIAHAAAQRAAEKSLVSKSAGDIFGDAMARLGWSWISNRWVKAPLKEDLDDKDEFTRDCTYCGIQSMGGMILDMNEFHEAHSTAREAAKKHPWDTQEYKIEYATVMSKYGYQYGPNYWAKA
jgi:hypothetical protein